MFGTASLQGSCDPLSPDREHALPYHSWQDSPWVSGRYLRGPVYFELPKSPWLWGRVFTIVSVTWSFHLGARSFAIFCFL